MKKTTLALLCVFVLSLLILPFSPQALAVDPDAELWVNGVNVDLNEDTVTLEIGDGTAVYTNETATLELNDVDITEGYQYLGEQISNQAGIYVRNMDLTMVLDGDNTIEGKDISDVIYVYNGDLTIESASSASASLSASSDYGLSIFYRDEDTPSTLTINDVDVTIITTDSYYSGAVSVENLVINNSNFIATNSYNSQALDISSLTVNGETIFPIPTSSSISINKDGEIGDKYSIWIGEIEITSENKDDVLGDGKVRYEPETNTLTLNGVTLTELGAKNAAIYSQGKGLTLELEADSSIELAPATEGEPIYGILAEGELTITGSDTGEPLPKFSLSIVDPQYQGSDTPVSFDGEDIFGLSGYDVMLEGVALDMAICGYELTDGIVYGIYSGIVSISDSELSIDVKDSSAVNAICCYGTWIGIPVEITNSVVTLENLSESAIGLQVWESNVDITESSVSVTSSSTPPAMAVVIENDILSIDDQSSVNFDAVYTSSVNRILVDDIIYTLDVADGQDYAHVQIDPNLGIFQGLISKTLANLSVNGETLVADGVVLQSSIDCGNGTAVYDQATNTLTLTNATIDTTNGIIENNRYYHEYGIYADGNLNLELVGENNIILDDTTLANSPSLQSALSLYGIFVFNNLNITEGEASGSLNIEMDIDREDVTFLAGIYTEMNLAVHSGAISIDVSSYGRVFGIIAYRSIAFSGPDTVIDVKTNSNSEYYNYNSALYTYGSAGGTEAGLFISDGAQVSVSSIYTNEFPISGVYVINLSGKLSIAGDNTVLTIFASPETDASPIWMKDFDTSDNGNWTLVIEPDTVWDLDEVPVPLTHLVNNGVVKMSDLSALPEGGIAGSGLLLVDGKYYDNTGKPYRESSPSKPSKHEDKEPDTPEVVQLPFDDVVKTDWFYDAVVYVWENELMEGVADTTFSPMEPLTRAMVWTILARSEGVDTTGGSSWYAKAQEWAITNGISDGENPDMPITREQLVTMLYRLDGEPEISGTLTEPTSDWAQSAVLWAQAENIFIGDNSGSIYPMVTTNRAEAAVVFMRWFEQ